MTLLIAGVAVGAARAQDDVPDVQGVIAQLRSEKAGERLDAVRILKQSAVTEAAVPIAAVLQDPDDRVQFEAIAAELNIFLANKVIPRRRVALVVEVRDQISAASVFADGPAVLDPRPVPPEVLTGLRAGVFDSNPRVATEALYAFGALAANVYGPARGQLLQSVAPELASALAAPQTELRGAAISVIARVFAWRPGDAAVPEVLGDAVVNTVNDRVAGIRLVAIEAVGRMRYERGLTSLTEIYQHYERGDQASAALGALARIAHPSSVPTFASALTSRDAAVRVAAVEGLARSGAADQVSPVMALATDRDDRVVLATELAGVLLSNRPVDAVIGALSDRRLRGTALDYLADIAVQKPAAVIARVEDPDPSIRADVLAALGRGGDITALGSAERFQADPDPAVARAARRAALQLSSGRVR